MSQLIGGIIRGAAEPREGGASSSERSSRKVSCWSLGFGIDLGSIWIASLVKAALAWDRLEVRLDMRRNHRTCADLPRFLEERA